MTSFTEDPVDVAQNIRLFRTSACWRMEAANISAMKTLQDRGKTAHVQMDTTWMLMD